MPDPAQEIPTQPVIQRRRAILLWVVAFIALAAAFAVDRNLTQAVLPFRDEVKGEFRAISNGIKSLGGGVTSGVAVVLLAIFHRDRGRAVVMVVISALIAGLVEVVFKWMVGRTRPVADEIVNIAPFDLQPFRGGIFGIANQKNLCFPSGHTLLAFSTAACLAYLCPRGKWVWFIAASLVAIERVAEVAHYPSDVVGAALIGILSARLARRIVMNRVDRPSVVSETNPIE